MLERSGECEIAAVTGSQQEDDLKICSGGSGILGSTVLLIVISSIVVVTLAGFT